jgi:hypothetical protein
MASQIAVEKEVRKKKQSCIVKRKKKLRTKTNFHKKISPSKEREISLLANKAKVDGHRDAQFF